MVLIFRGKCFSDQAIDAVKCNFHPGRLYRRGINICHAGVRRAACQFDDEACVARSNARSEPVGSTPFSKAHAAVGTQVVAQH